MSTNSELGILPPGKITNDELFEQDNETLRKNLILDKDYTTVS
jgi:hypothetical protein